METKAAGHDEQHKHGNMKLSKNNWFFPSVLTTIPTWTLKMTTRKSPRAPWGAQEGTRVGPRGTPREPKMPKDRFRKP